MTQTRHKLILFPYSVEGFAGSDIFCNYILQGDPKNRTHKSLNKIFILIIPLFFFRL